MLLIVSIRNSIALIDVLLQMFTLQVHWSIRIRMINMCETVMGSGTCTRV